MENKNVFDYFKERNRKNNLQLKKLLTQLPSFCYEFFLGIEGRTTPLTRVNYAYDLRVFFDFLTKEIVEFVGKDIKEIELSDIEKISVTHLEIYLNYLNMYNLNGKIFENTAVGKSRKLSTLRSFFKYFFKKEKLISNVTAKVDFPKVHSKGIVRLEVDEVTNILNTAEFGDELTKHQSAFHEHTRLRDTALLTLMLGTGIRVSECVGLNIEDIDLSNNSFRVTRKGGDQVILYFSDEVALTIKEYIKHREEMKGVDEKEHALFLSLQKKRIGVRGVEKLVKKYAGIVTPLKKITPHKLRSTYGTNLYQETKDIYIVADVLGHKDINTTKKHYAAQVDDNRRNAANKIKLR